MDLRCPQASNNRTRIRGSFFVIAAQAAIQCQEPGFDRLSLTEGTLACHPLSVIAAQAAIQWE